MSHRTDDVTAVEEWLERQLLTESDHIAAQVFLFGMPPLQGAVRKTTTPGVFQVKAVAPGPGGGAEMMDVRFSCKYVVAIRLIDEEALPAVGGGSGIHLS